MNINDSTYDLSPDLEAKWESALDSMDRMKIEGNYGGALEMALAAWGFLPEPKLNCSYAYITAMPLLKSFIMASSFEEGISFADFLINNTPRKNEIPVFIVQKGILMYESGDVEGAYSEFKRAWDIAGKFGFLDEDRKYLDFLNSK